MSIGEIIETSTRNCIAQSYELEKAPILGSLVKIGKVYGVVCEVRTASLDPSRKPQVLGDGIKKLAEVLQEQPQLKSLLRTEFEIQLVGEDGLPDSAPSLHAQVEETKANALKDNLRYLYYLKDLAVEVIIKHLKLLAGKDEELKLRATRELAHVLRTDQEKLEELIERM
jgi:hypothetical protein